MILGRDATALVSGVEALVAVENALGVGASTRPLLLLLRPLALLLATVAIVGGRDVVLNLLFL